ncbi:MerR family transcriptional regulator [Streptomyces sp. NPDC050161]|uniref:DNA polymerase III subunit beta family protein n=1 Tax=Streptomyces sp. NPDC050161 TaxID=3365604 RepID=UPI0037AB0CF1
MDDTEELLSIGAFARRVGLAPSALRFYDDCGVLRPARVDEVSGYRYYAAEQVPRAVRLRRLREAGLPLVDVPVVLDGPESAARGVLRQYLERTLRTADEARAVVEGFLREAPDDGGRARARVCGAELASAVRQVAPAAAGGAAREEFPVLGGVLLELADDEVRLVATDRYRLALRVLRSQESAGGPHRVLIGADEVRDMADWALRQVTVEIEADGHGVRLRSGECSGAGWTGSGDLRVVGGDAEGFPDYRLMLAALEAGRHRLILDRGALREAVAGRHGAVSLAVEGADGGGRESGSDGGVGADQVVIAAGGGREAVRLRGIRTGPAVRVAFDPAVLMPALEAGVGPDVLLEIASAGQPVVVRSADQGSFSTLVMPVREDGGATCAAEEGADGGEG